MRSDAALRISAKPCGLDKPQLLLRLLNPYRQCRYQLQISHHFWGLAAGGVAGAFLGAGDGVGVVRRFFPPMVSQ